MCTYHAYESIFSLWIHLKLQVMPGQIREAPLKGVLVDGLQRPLGDVLEAVEPGRELPAMEPFIKL